MLNNDGFQDASIEPITALLTDYFDGLYDGDVDKFKLVFHPQAHLYSTDGETVTDLPLDAYLELIRCRASPRAQQLKRHDRILSIHRSGPNTALATVECAMPPRYFVDYLTLMCDGGGWQIISKSFHTNVHE
jgi:predicted ATPase